MKVSNAEFLPPLTRKDLRQIERIFEEDVQQINSHTDLDVESKEAILCSIHLCLYESKRMAKKKFTPKKYRYWEN